MPAFDLQGHRGARGLRPENTLPSFEAALDAGATTIETDLHLTADGVVVLCHDPVLTPAIFQPLDDRVPPPGPHLAVRSLTLHELHGYRAAGNPDTARFPDQDPAVTLLAARFARDRLPDPYAVPTLADLFAFAAAYAGPEGEQAGKTPAQRRHAGLLRFDLELKRVPFFPETLADGYTGQAPGLLEEQVVAAVRAAGVTDRTTVRSFDHRSVLFLRRLEPRLTGAVLVADTAPIDPVQVAREAEADLYCPSYRFVDEGQVRRLHAGGVRVIPWTVNEPAHWRRLRDWGVDGLTTDYPDRLAAWLLRHEA
jgi:glycerophosphoryl diester phosphodiesterase